MRQLWATTAHAATRLSPRAPAPVKIFSHTYASTGKTRRKKPKHHRESEWHFCVPASSSPKEKALWPKWYPLSRSFLVDRWVGGSNGCHGFTSRMKSV